MSGQEAKAPPLRFMSTLEPWERKRFGDFATLRRGLTYTPADCREKGVRVLRSSNISDETFVLHSDDVFVSEQAANIPFVRNGDILITAANGSSHLVGKHALIDGVGEKDTVHGGFMLLAESDFPEFLDAAMSAPWYKQFVADYMMGGNGALGNLAKSSFDECAFLAPSTQHEQRRIGSLFRSLDALIVGREKALEKLETLKKSMLVKMFPQGDAPVPEVRFKGFAGEWEKKRLGDVADFNPKCTLPNSFEYVDLESVVGTEILTHRTESKTTAPSRAQRLAKFGDVFYQTVRPYQKNNCIFTLTGTRPFVFSTGYAQLRPKCDGYFLLSLLQNDLFVNRVLDECTGTSYPAINDSRLSDIPTAIPSDKNEQQKIGAYFRSLDALLAARREEIGKLKQMKKALLERMFV